LIRTRSGRQLFDRPSYLEFFLIIVLKATKTVLNVW